jgi:hypothetical protein
MPEPKISIIDIELTGPHWLSPEGKRRQRGGDFWAGYKRRRQRDLQRAQARQRGEREDVVPPDSFKDWDPDKHPRGKTTEASTPGSFAPSGGGGGGATTTTRGRSRRQQTERDLEQAQASLMRVRERVAAGAKADPELEQGLEQEVAELQRELAQPEPAAQPEAEQQAEQKWWALSHEQRIAAMGAYSEARRRFEPGTDVSQAWQTASWESRYGWHEEAERIAAMRPEVTTESQRIEIARQLGFPPNIVAVMRPEARASLEQDIDAILAQQRETPEQREAARAAARTAGEERLARFSRQETDLARQQETERTAELERISRYARARHLLATLEPLSPAEQSELQTLQAGLRVGDLTPELRRAMSAAELEAARAYWAREENEARTARISSTGAARNAAQLRVGEAAVAIRLLTEESIARQQQRELAPTPRASPEEVAAVMAQARRRVSMPAEEAISPRQATIRAERSMSGPQRDLPDKASKLPKVVPSGEPADIDSESVRGLAGEMTASFRKHFGADAVVTTEVNLDAKRVRIYAKARGSTVDRVLDFDDDIVNHAYFKIAEESRGTGVAVETINEQVQLYKQMGFSRVKVHANIDVGGYVWARYGWVPNEDSWSDLAADARGKIIALIRDRDEGIVTVTGSQSLEQMLEHARSYNPRSMWTLADTDIVVKTQGGTEFALGYDLFGSSDWSGTLDLRDPETLTRFDNYVAGKRRRQQS